MLKRATHCVILKAEDGRVVNLRVNVNPRARRISLRIDAHTREAVATAPTARAQAEAIAFARSRLDWIWERLDAAPPPAPFAPNALAPFRGELHRLVARDKGRSVRLAADLETPEIRVPGAPETFAKKTAAFFKAAARTDLSDRVAVHAQTLGVEPTSIAIKDTRSRWGSCSSEGRLNFSWRLVCAPPFVLDYVAAHEVAHL
ncbi:MAG: YgjP-like metallopeptidase domain-containing protein, partial [Pseudomonadota bacterium]